jgi:hypothetical protein
MSVAFKLWVLALLVGLADWLFFEPAPGLSMVIYLAALVGAATAVSETTPAWPRVIAAIALFVFAVLPLVESFGIVPLFFGVAGGRCCAACPMSHIALRHAPTPTACSRHQLGPISRDTL